MNLEYWNLSSSFPIDVQAVKLKKADDFYYFASTRGCNLLMSCLIFVRIGNPTSPWFIIWILKDRLVSLLTRQSKSKNSKEHFKLLSLNVSILRVENYNRIQKIWSRKGWFKRKFWYFIVNVVGRMLGLSWR